jgi:hypothetical protein
VNVTAQPEETVVDVNVKAVEADESPKANVADAGEKVPQAADGVIVIAVPAYCGTRETDTVPVAVCPTYRAGGRVVTAMVSRARTLIVCVCGETV